MTQDTLKARVRQIDGCLIDDLNIEGGRDAFYRWSEQQIDSLTDLQAAFLAARGAFTTPSDFGRLLRTARQSA